MDRLRLLLDALWTPDEDGLLRSIGAAGESATAIATLLKRKAAGVHQRLLS